ncbi:NUDIX domain-containing protein [Thioclava sp. A2]|uniref:NUDIX domain-containing protein n=1 Tax=Thioclava sp. FCG-A2 TaxID=3080562 RepID=UPI0029552955|nr:NUDIX domain-containing protein [Thioclava sp. A2]MDV7270695.1 NUDIX domain-containing protein [Thioclava sp. A2]
MSEFFFFYGPLRDESLRRIVIGRPSHAQPALLRGYCVTHVSRDDPGPDLPVLDEGKGVVEGALVRLSTPERDRVDFYEYGLSAEQVEVEVADETVPALCYRLAVDGARSGGRSWSFDVWTTERAALVRAAASDVMLGFGRYAASVMAARRPLILARAASRLRAEAETVPDTLDRPMTAADVSVKSRALGYANFFAVEDYTLAHKTFAGGQGADLERAVFISADAACLLPYDPVRDRVLLIEQFRPGPMARGDRSPWLLEPVAGRVDPDETPEQAARREAVEEAGLSVDRLVAAPNYYPSPAAKAEFLYNYIALADLPDTLPQGGGLEHEGEDIRSHLVPFAQLMAMVESGEARNGPLCVLALWLERLRPKLRAEAGIADTRGPVSA